MKKIILILIIIFSYNLLLSDWKKVDRRPDYDSSSAYSTYDGLKCADSLNCMAWSRYFGKGYYFRRTTDGGNTWKTVRNDSSYFHSPTDFYTATNINDIAYPNTKLFIGVGDNGLIIRTTDKGETWQKYTYDIDKKFYGILILDTSVIILK